MEGGQLPEPRKGLRTTLVFVSGGEDDDYNDLTSILSWDPVAKSWQPAGELAVRRDYHAAVAVSTSLVEC